MLKIEQYAIRSFKSKKKFIDELHTLVLPKINKINEIFEKEEKSKI